MPLEGSIECGQLIKQAVLNLMLNAVQAMSGMPAGAAKELILRTSREAEHDGQAVNVLHVIDTGPGIDAGVLPRIFTPYYTTKSGGSGLGLPTARRLD